MQLADRNNWSLTEAKAKVTSSELMLWKAYIAWEANAFHREDYYLAQIAQEVRRVLSKSPKKIKLDHFLLKFETKSSKARAKAESVETRTTRSKSFWFGIVGVKGPIEKREADG